MRITAFALLLVTAFTASARAQALVDPAGHWKGTIDIPNQVVEFEIDLAKNSRGEMIGTVTAGPTAATIPLMKIAISGRKITFAARADQPFEGEVSETGRIISGTATLSGYALPFTMARTGDAKIEPTPTSRAVSKALEGEWRGTLSAGDKMYRLIVSISNQPDGTALAHSVSVDEGGMIVPLVVVEDGTNVRVESQATRIAYTGVLNAGGTELTGTFTQGALSVPMTFTRAVPEGQR